MRIVPLLVSFGVLGASLTAQANCTAGPGPATSLATMDPFAGGSLYGHPGYPAPLPPTFPGFSFVVDMQPIVDIEISVVDLDLYDDGNLVNVGNGVTVTSPNQIGATAPVTAYLHLGPTWAGQEGNQAAWVPLGVGLLTVAAHHTDSTIVFSPPIPIPAGSWGFLLQVPMTMNGPNPGPLHPMVDPGSTTPGVYTDNVLTMVNVRFQRESWVATSLTPPAHTQSLEFHYQPLNGYANWTSFGTGCGTPPQLGLTARPRIGTSIDFEASNIVAGALVNFWLVGFVPDPAGVSLAQFGLPGCNLYMPLNSPIVTTLTGVTNGISNLQIALPNDPSYSGVVMFGQAAPPTNGGALAFHASNGVCVAIDMF